MNMQAEILPFPNARTGGAKSPSPPRHRIAFVINSLGPGGAERVMDSLLHMAPKEGWECHLILLDRETEWRTPPDFVHVHRLDCRFSFQASIRQLRATLTAIRPELVVSFLVRANVAAVIAARAVRAATIISERSHLTTHLAGRHTGLRRWLATVASRLTYPRADHVIAVSDGVRTDLVENFDVDPDRVTSIPNPYDLERIGREAQAEPQIPLPERFMVSVGRLVGAKGFDDLVHAYALAKPEIALCILGEGPDRSRLEARIAAMGLSERVHLLGYVKNPFSVVRRAELFVSASHCEGFPNAMAEAMTLGLPVVATDCPSGPAEILAGVETTHTRDVYEGEYGVLVPVRRPEAMARAMDMMANPARRVRYSAMSRQRMDSFRIEAISDRYWKTFADVLDKHFGVTAPTPRSPHAAGRETG
jgi:glycosyltransferase involved in cell wall biosynthesis